jgi:ATP-dependent Clp protease ATP-binding subunit ClpA
LTDLLANVKGQAHILPDIIAHLNDKMRYPSQQMVLHFAGDHGVGKTYVAKLISLVMSTHCAAARGPPHCEYGASMLIISGTGYDGDGGKSLPNARSLIVNEIVQHATAHPNGVVLLDDLSALDPAVVSALSPLLGRAAAFPDFPDVRLNELLVILTTDLGNQGRTRNKTVQQIRTMVEEEFGFLYGTTAVSHVHTFPFLPLTMEHAIEIIRNYVVQTPCREPRVAHMTIDEFTAYYFAAGINERVTVENGHAIDRNVKSAVNALISRAVDEFGSIDARGLNLHLAIEESTKRPVVSHHNSQVRDPEL